MKKLLASATIALIILGSAIIYTDVYPKNHVKTVAVQSTDIENNLESEFTVTNINPDNDNININDYMGDWRTSSLSGSIHSSNELKENTTSNINISKDIFKVSTTNSNTTVDNIIIKKPTYQVQKLPESYFKISFYREPEALGLSSKNNYQVLINNSPTDLYISNGKLIYNSAGSFFNLSK